jgi:DNA repair protein RecO (recombination protein O)
LDDFVREQERDDGLFILLKDSFEKLNGDHLKKENCDLVYYYFLWNFFATLGFKPELQKCADCFSKINQEKIYFSNKEGGIICEKCLATETKAEKINSDVVKILRLILENNWQIISKLKIDFSSEKLLQEISDSYYFYLLNK